MRKKSELEAETETKRVKLLTRPRKKRCCAPKPEAAAQCCAKASRLVAGCHD